MSYIFLERKGWECFFDLFVSRSPDATWAPPGRVKHPLPPLITVLRKLPATWQVHSPPATI